MLIQMTGQKETLETNPLLDAWSGNYGGVPAFDKIQPRHFPTAFDQMREKRLTLTGYAANSTDEPSFANTILPLEQSQRIANQFNATYSLWSGNISTPDFQTIERELAPKLAQLDDEIFQNEMLFGRIERIYTSDQRGLSDEQKRLLWVHYTNFTLAGANLNKEDKARLKSINTTLANLSTEFQQNILADENDQYLVIDSELELDGLPQFFKDAARSEAEERKLHGKWVVSNTRSSIDPFLSYATNRKLREQAWKMFINRGDNNNSHNNNNIIVQILKLRQERAALLGFKDHAHWKLQNTMAKTPERAMDLLLSLWTPAINRVREEVADMQAIADRDATGAVIEPWDYHFYMEKVRKARFDFDQNDLKPYLQLDNLLKAMFYVGERLYNVKFTRVSDVPVYHEDVSVYKVEDLTLGKISGLFYFDPFARKGKRSGAWMNSLRDQENFEGEIIPIVSNNSNFIKGKPGEPVLISWDDATTLFHEFGHALHGLLSKVSYPTLSGTNVVRDYVEFPSQVTEHWLSTPDVRNRYMVHYQTGKPLPQELIDKMEKASTFNQGFATTEYLSSALIDMKLHSSPDEITDPSVFEKDTLTQLGMPRELVMRHRTPQFMHIFVYDYSAGYYSYLWSDVLTADAWEAFTDSGDPFDSALAQRLKQYVFSAGNTRDPEEGYRNFRGRDAKVEALMKKRGFGLKVSS